MALYLGSNKIAGNYNEPENVVIYENEAGLGLSNTIGTAKTFTGINLSSQDYSKYNLNVYVGFTAPDGTRNTGIQKFTFDLMNYNTITSANIYFMSGYSGGSTNDFFMIVANISALNTTTWQWRPTSVKWFQSNNTTGADTNLLSRLRLFKIELELK